MELVFVCSIWFIYFHLFLENFLYMCTVYLEHIHFSLSPSYSYKETPSTSTSHLHVFLLWFFH